MPQATSWRQLATGARQAARLVCPSVKLEDCLPGEPEGPGCGLDEVMHYLGYLSTVKAIADHYLGHIKDPELSLAVMSVYEGVAGIMAGDCGDC